MSLGTLQRGRCERPGEYSAGSNANGSFEIIELNGGKVPSSGSIVGDRILRVQP
jgi:hypothetical protein